MSTPSKPKGTPSGQPETELDKLKAVWRRLPDDARSYWLEQFESQRTQADLRKEIQAKFKIVLARDNQLTRFRQFVDRQQALDAEAWRAKQDEAELIKQYGDDWTLDQIREEVLKKSYARALATGDFDAGRKTIVQDLNVKKVSLDERKLKLLEKKAEQFDKAKEVIESKLTPEEQRQRLKEILK